MFSLLVQDPTPMSLVEEIIRRGLSVEVAVATAMDRHAQVGFEEKSRGE